MSGGEWAALAVAGVAAVAVVALVATMARLSPTRVSNELTTTVKAAVTEGREAMRARERELRAELGQRYERAAGPPVG